MRARIWLRFSGLSAYGSLPSRLTCPVLGLRRPPAINSSVVFPQPLGPRTAKNSPGETDKQTSSRAVTLPSGPLNHLLIFLNSSILISRQQTSDSKPKISELYLLRFESCTVYSSLNTSAGSCRIAIIVGIHPAMTARAAAPPTESTSKSTTERSVPVIRIRVPSRAALK